MFRSVFYNNRFLCWSGKSKGICDTKLWVSCCSTFVKFYLYQVKSRILMSSDEIKMTLKDQQNAINNLILHDKEE